MSYAKVTMRRIEFIVERNVKKMSLMFSSLFAP